MNDTPAPPPVFDPATLPPPSPMAWDAPGGMVDEIRVVHLESGPFIRTVVPVGVAVSLFVFLFGSLGVQVLGGGGVPLRGGLGIGVASVASVGFAAALMLFIARGLFNYVAAWTHGWLVRFTDECAWRAGWLGLSRVQPGSALKVGAAIGCVVAVLGMTPLLISHVSGLVGGYGRPAVFPYQSLAQAGWVAMLAPVGAVLAAALFNALAAKFGPVRFRCTGGSAVRPKAEGDGPDPELVVVKSVGILQPAAVMAGFAFALVLTLLGPASLLLEDLPTAADVARFVGVIGLCVLAGGVAGALATLALNTAARLTGGVTVELC